MLLKIALFRLKTSLETMVSCLVTIMAAIQAAVVLIMLQRGQIIKDYATKGTYWYLDCDDRKVRFATYDWAVEFILFILSFCSLRKASFIRSWSHELIFLSCVLLCIHFGLELHACSGAYVYRFIPRRPRRRLDSG